MDLIIKPTELCNFACTFCSSPDLSESRSSTLDLEKVKEFLIRYPNTRTIIVNGGDPLMVQPEYYYEILNFINSQKMATTLSFTTNLWDFYLRPQKWVGLFKEENVGVGTSFNYGATRKINRNTIYDEEKFWKVSNLFLEKVGYRPDFISVVTPENEDKALDNVRLAKKMDVTCKLNYAVGSGRQTDPYVLSKIYNFYLQIIEEGLTRWEFNTQELIKGMSKEATVCPRSRNCDSHIRCLQPDGDYYSCGAFGDDKEYKIDFESEMNGEKYTPLNDDLNLLSMKEECLACPLFSLCNGCRKTVKDMKESGQVEEHCRIMKGFEKKLTAFA
tara:strand:- start:62708 stop:63697 length:990 start_codon:yes stop_codon:yes gene_type:complete